MIKIWGWINERFPFDKILKLGIDENIPGGSRLSYVLGSATLLVLFLQVLTGILELFYYVPTVDHAYDSLNYFRTEVPFGWLIHGLHYWGANVFVVLVGLHMLRVFIWGAYKKPREMTWLFGLVLLLFTIAMSFTGAALPWDQRGFWAAKVGTNIGGTIPIVGPLVQFILRGGFNMGQLTLSRFFVLHTAIFPVILFLFVGFHIIAFRKFGSVGPWDQEKRNSFSSFWPDQVFKDVLFALIIIIGLVALASFVPPPFAGPADPMDSTYIPKPEWNFLFLYQALKFLPGKLEIIGTVGLPLIFILILILLPFLDKNPEKNPLKRKIVFPSGILIVLAILGLTLSGYLSNESNLNKSTPITKVVYSESVRSGKNLFTSLGCIGCHSVLGTGGTIGPDLSNEDQKNRSTDWIIQQLENSKSHNPKSIMPSFAFLSKKQQLELVSFLLHPISVGIPNGNQETSDSSNNKSDQSKNSEQDSVGNSKTGLAAFIIGSPDHGEVLFNKFCISCHGRDGIGGIKNEGSTIVMVPKLNPISPELYNSDPDLFSQNIDKFIQHGAIPQGKNPAFKMEAYGDKNLLTQQEISDIESYVLKLNKVERGMLINPGIQPVRFFEIFLGIILLTVLLLLFYKIFSKTKRQLITK
jgi:ubiquinol-cytochrome c reductase cytochrome b subunit